MKSMILLNLSVSHANFYMNHMPARFRCISHATKVGCVLLSMHVCSVHDVPMSLCMQLLLRYMYVHTYFQLQHGAPFKAQGSYYTETTVS